MRRILMFVSATLLTLGFAGCASDQAYGPESPYYRYPTGGRLVLNGPIEILPGEATVRLQFGRVVARNAVLDYEPYCIFELTTVRETRQRVEPGSFEILRVTRSTYMSGLPYDGLVRKVRVSDDDGGPSHIFYRTHFWLRSAKQPNVYALTCESNQYLPGVYPFMRHLTLAEIQQALGEIFTLQLPEPVVLAF